jgi:hypothetical protein
MDRGPIARASLTRLLAQRRLVSTTRAKVFVCSQCTPVEQFIVGGAAKYLHEGQIKNLVRVTPT